MTRRPAAILAAALVAAALGLAACGGDDDEDTTTSAPTTTTTAGATGATGADDTGDTGDTGGATYDITAGEFIAASLPDQIKAVQDYVADAPDECGDVDTKGGSDFQVAVAIAAASADPETPLADVILEECEQGA